MSIMLIYHCLNAVYEKIKIAERAKCQQDGGKYYLAHISDQMFNGRSIVIVQLVQKLIWEILTF